MFLKLVSYTAWKSVVCPAVLRVDGLPLPAQLLARTLCWLARAGSLAEASAVWLFQHPPRCRQRVDRGSCFLGFQWSGVLERNLLTVLGSNLTVWCWSSQCGCGGAAEEGFWPCVEAKQLLVVLWPGLPPLLVLSQGCVFPFFVLVWGFFGGFFSPYLEPYFTADLIRTIFHYFFTRYHWSCWGWRLQSLQWILRVTRRGSTLCFLGQQKSCAGGGAYLESWGMEVLFSYWCLSAGVWFVGFFFLSSCDLALIAAYKRVSELKWKCAFLH